MKIRPVHLLRIGLGIDMLMHGVVRIPNLQGFVNHSMAGFTTSFLPSVLVRWFLTVLPFLEALIGLMILIGGKIGRAGFVAGGFLMAVLLFGTTTRQDWPLVSQQVIYLTAFAIALQFHDQQSSTAS